MKNKTNVAFCSNPLRNCDWEWLFYLKITPLCSCRHPMKIGNDLILKTMNPSLFTEFTGGFREWSWIYIQMTEKFTVFLSFARKRSLARIWIVLTSSRCSTSNPSPSNLPQFRAMFRFKSFSLFDSKSNQIRIWWSRRKPLLQHYCNSACSKTGQHEEMCDVKKFETAWAQSMITTVSISQIKFRKRLKHTKQATTTYQPGLSCRNERSQHHDEFPTQRRRKIGPFCGFEKVWFG